MDFGFSYISETLIMIFYATLWFLEVSKLLAEILMLYIAIVFISMISAVLYVLNFSLVILILLLIEVVSIAAKLIILLVQGFGAIFFSAAVSSSCFFIWRETREKPLSSDPEAEHLEIVNKLLGDMLDDVDSMLKKKPFNQTVDAKQSLPVKRVPDKEVLRSCIRKIIGKAVKLFKEDLENMKFLAEVVAELSTRGMSVEDLELPLEVREILKILLKYIFMQLSCLLIQCACTLKMDNT